MEIPMMKGLKKWAGKIAVVTGASSGIGQATVITLAENGIIVIGLARRYEKVETMAKEITGTVHAIKCDLTKEEDIIEAFRKIDEKYGGVDLLVNCAGIIRVDGVMSGAISDWKDVLDLNVTASAVCCREAIKSMRDKKGDTGQIILMNSLAGHIVPQSEVVFFGLYYASKHAITALSETIRVELIAVKSNIKITCISPASVYTHLTEKVVADLKKVPFDASAPLRTPPPSFLIAQDVADTILYVLSTRPGVQIKDILLHPVGMKYH